MNWPDDADGDVFRRLESGGFNFNTEHIIDFNIDFEHWPLSTEAIKAFKYWYPNCEFVEPDEEDIKNGEMNGYILFTITNKLTYKLVIETQQEATKKAKKYGGWCESWGISN